MKKSILTVSLILLFFVPVFSGEEDAISLETCYRKALQANLSVLQKKLDVSESGLNTRKSYSELYPSASGSVGMNASSTETGGITTDRNGYSLSASLNQNIYYPGMYTYLKIARLNEGVSNIQYEDALAQLKSNVVNYYFSILASDELILVYRENIRFAGENIKRIRSMFELGARTESDVLKAEVQKGQFETQLLNEKQKNADLKRKLNLLMGRLSSEQLKLQPVQPLKEKLPELADARNLMLKSNRVMQTMDEQKKIQELSLKTKKESYYPTVAGSYHYSYADNDAGTTTSNSVSLNASVNIFNGFKRSADRQISEIALKRTDLQIEETKRELVRELENLYESIQIQDALQSVYEKSLVSAQRDYELVTQQLQIGSSTVLDQLDAQLSVLQSQSNLVDVRYNRKITEAHIKYLLGE